MLVDEYDCYCPNCKSKQKFYYFMSLNVRSDMLPHMNNKCSDCGSLLHKEDVPDWPIIEKKYRGDQGENGIIN